MNVIITIPMIESVKNCLPDRKFSEEEVTTLIRAAYEPLGMNPLALNISQAVLMTGHNELKHHFPHSEFSTEVPGLVFAAMVDKLVEQQK